MSRPADVTAANGSSQHAPSERHRLLALSNEALLAECKVDRFRGSGPGGQKRNKTESAVRLRHLDTGLAALASDSRSQHNNLRTALRRLRVAFVANLREAVKLDDYRAPPELAALMARPSRLRYRAQDVLERAQGYAALLDLFAAVDGSMAAAARALKISTGALSRLLGSNESVWRAANEIRAASGLSPLRAP